MTLLDGGVDVEIPSPRVMIMTGSFTWVSEYQTFEATLCWNMRNYGCACSFLFLRMIIKEYMSIPLIIPLSQLFTEL